MNGSFHAARRPSDASRLSVIEILLTVQGVGLVCGMLSFFQNRLLSQLPAVRADGFIFSLFIDDGMLPFVCLSGCVRACMLACLRGAPTSVHVIFVIVPVSVSPPTDLLYPLLFASSIICQSARPVVLFLAVIV